VPDWFPWIPRGFPLPSPGGTPSIPDQVRCPAGSHRELGTGRCVLNAPPPPPTIVEVPTAPPEPREPRPGERPPKPPDEGRGPLPLPPVLPPPVAAPSPVDATTGRYFPRSARPATRGVLRPLLGVPGALAWVLGTLVFGPYFTGTTREYERELERTSTRGPPRRRNPPKQPDENVIEPPFPMRFPGYRFFPTVVMPLPHLPAKRPTNNPRRYTNPPPVPYQESPFERIRRTLGTEEPPVSPRSRAVPGPRTSVPVMPVEPSLIWGPVHPETVVDYDPYTTYSPTPSRRIQPFPTSNPVPRQAPTGPLGLPLQGPWFDPFPFAVPRTGRGTRRVPSPRARPLNPQQPLTPQPRPTPTPRLPTVPAPGPGLTPIQDPVGGLSPQPGFRKASPPRDPCTEARSARRRRQQECKRFKTKTIRVCADRR